MALQLAKELDSGAQAMYHRITGLQMDIAQQRAMVHVSGYISGAARQAGKEPIQVRVFRIDREAYPFTADAMAAANAIAIAYGYLKAQAEYAGAADV